MSTDIAPSEPIFFSPALTDDERTMLSALLSPNQNVEEIIPDSTDPDTLWSYLSVSCKALMRVRDLTAQLRPLIGRILLLVKQYPDLYQGREGMNPETGEKKVMLNFEDFILYGLPAAIGMSRAGAYLAQKIALRFPELPLSKYSQIGATKMQSLTQLPFGENGKPPKDIDRWIETAADPRVTFQAFREMVANRTLQDPGDLEMSSVVVNMTKAQRELWRRYKTDRTMQQYAESTAEGRILEVLMIEAEPEWRAAVMALRPDSGV